MIDFWFCSGIMEERGGLMKILCFGDSNTYGYDPRGYFGGRYDPQDRWPEILAAQTGWEVLNLGENGRMIPRSVDGLPRADRVLVMLGTNDLLQGATARETAERMGAFLADAQVRWGEVLLICPPPMKRGAWVPTEALAAESVRLGAEYKALAARLGIPFLDTRSWGIELAFDGVHFTEKGHRAFGEKLGRKLIPIWSR